MKTPLLLIVVALALAAPAAAQKHGLDEGEVAKPLPGVPAVRALTAGAPEAPATSTPTTASTATQAALAKIGWKAIDDDALVRLAGADKGYVPGNYLTEGDIEWRKGALAFKNGDPLTPAQIGPILEGLWLFVRAASEPPAETGKMLAAWGLPPVIDGRKIVSPNGDATYYGQMLRLLYADKPDAVKRAGVQRLAQALDLLTEARGQAFDRQAADIAKTDADRAKLILLSPARPGETPLGVAPYQDLGAQYAEWRGKLEADRAAAIAAGDELRRKDTDAALATLNAAEKKRYHTNLNLPAVPKPGEALDDGDDGDASKSKPGAKSAPVELASGLPGLLRVLDRVNGKPLTADQQENLIKSFPMGDLVWRLGAQDLWRQGITGVGVKVAVIDGGIGPHSELATAVKSRANFTADRGAALVSDHGTHVAGIIHAIAPDAELRGYTVLTGDAGNPRLKENADTAILKAVDQAVADGNRVISMSLGADGSPSNELARKIEEYAKAGVIFVVAAGNERDQNGVEAPSIAPNALTVGALDAAGRPADFSSYGSNFDARKLSHVVKSVFMAPGTNIYSTVVDGKGKSGYELMDGTSMATPAVSGVTALLWQAGTNFTANPVELSGRVRDALADGSTPLPLDALPPNAPFDQPYLVVKPLAALTALRRAPPVVDAPAGKKKNAGRN